VLECETRTDAWTDAAALLLASVTVAPVTPGLELKVTVPVEPTPPATEVGESEILVTCWAFAMAVIAKARVRRNGTRQRGLKDFAIETRGSPVVEPD